MFSAFMLNSWLAGSAIAVTAGCIGFFAVLRGESFAAHALPLSTFPGAAAAALLGLNPFYGLISFALLGTAGITWLGRHQRHDVATALTLITLLGLGTLFLSLSNGYANAVYALLFGEILGISLSAVTITAILTLATLTALTLMFRPLLLSSISPDLVAAAGAAPQKTGTLFLTLLALTTAIALPITGALLVFSLLIGPAAAARSLSPRPITAMLTSAALALITIWTAIALAYTTNYPVGFFVGTISAVWYGLGRVVRGN
jgi:zinc/manganese transport system permease protein